MAWSAPATFTTGNVLTAAQLNTNLRDNTLWLHDPPGCQISRTASIAITSSTAGVELTLGVINYDTDTMTGTANRIVTHTAGVYNFSFNVEWAAQSGGGRVAAIVAAASGQNVAVSYTAPAGTAAANTCSGDYVCTASQVFEQNVWQNSGSTVSVLGTSIASPITGGNAACNFSAHWIGAG